MTSQGSLSVNHQETVRRPAAYRYAAMGDGQAAKLVAAFDFLEREAVPDGPLDIGQIALATALSWIEFRNLPGFARVARSSKPGTTASPGARRCWRHRSPARWSSESDRAKLNGRRAAALHRRGAVRRGETSSCPACHSGPAGQRRRRGRGAAAPSVWRVR